MSTTFNARQPSSSARAYLALALCVLVVWGQAASSWLSHRALANINQSLPTGIELFCTGSSMKFVSLPASLEAGKVVFVSPPQSQQDEADYWCQIGQAILDDDALDHAFASQLIILTPHRSSALRTPSDALSQTHYPSAQPRSPPFSA